MKPALYQFHGWNLRARRRRPSATKPPQFIRYLGRHGSLHLIEVLYRGKRVLRYVKDTDSVTPVMALESTTGGNTPVSEERAGQQAPN